MKRLSIESLESRCLLTASLFMDVLQAPEVSFSPRELVVLDDQILFSAVDELHGRELWTSDGTTEGTRLLKDITLGAVGSNPSGLFLLEDRVYFTVGEKPWSSDGTPQGTSPIEELPENPIPHSYFPAGPVEYHGGTFAIERLFVGWRLLKLENDATGVEVHDLGRSVYHASNFGEPGIEILNDMMFIVANGFANDGGGLWTSDGAAAGTERFMEIDSEGYLVRMGNELFFSARDGLDGFQLWRSDGTPEGTVALTDFGFGNASSNPHAFVSFQDDLYFATLNEHQHSPMLWRMEGSEPVLVKEMPVGSVDFCTERGQIRYPIEAGGTLFFIQDYGTESCAGAYRLVADLWSSDGTTGGTQMLVSSIRTRTGREFVPVGDPVFAAFQDELLFTVRSGAHEQSSGRSDGSIEGTRLTDISVNAPTVIDDQLIFVSNNQLWVEDTDGQQNSVSGDEVRVSAGGLAEVGERIFFVGSSDDVGNRVWAELWQTDGTTTGTTLIKEVTVNGDPAAPLHLTNVDGGLMFFAVSERRYQLWRSDGTGSGTSPASSRIFSDASEVIAANGKLFFRGTAGGVGGLWVFDAAADVELQKLLDFDTTPFSGGNNSPPFRPSKLTAFDDSVYFVASDDVHGRELWKTDGTREGTVLVTDISSGPADSNPSDLTVIGDTLYFAADDGIHGREIWAVEGQVETDLIGDVDGDGVVGFSDFLVLSANFGVEENATREMGDLNDDQSIDFDDFLLLKQNLGRTLPAV